MSTTQKRLISAFVIIAIIAISIWQGIVPAKVLCFVFGLFVCDELFTNFYQVERFSSKYLLSIVPFIAIIAFDSFYVSTLGLSSLWSNIILCGALGICFFLALFLFNVNVLKAKSLFESLSPCFLSLFILVLFRIIDATSFPYALIGLLILVTSADAGAWFFGKKFGKTPLWKSVSPNKTREGAIAGMLCTALTMTLYWNWIFPSTGIKVALFFMILAVVSIIGDLIQSKLKRHYSIKDSSSLIPGHGGFFDRADSILFTAPFYLLLIKLI